MGCRVRKNGLDFMTWPNNAQPLEFVGYERKMSHRSRNVSSSVRSDIFVDNGPKGISSSVRSGISSAHMKQQHQQGGAVVCNSPLSPGVDELVRRHPSAL